MWHVIWPIILGVTGCLVANLLIKPLLTFLSLRSQVYEELVFSQNVDDGDAAEYKRSIVELRRLGARIQATNVIATGFLRLIISKLDYDLDLAGLALIDLSHSMSRPERHRYIDRIEEGLHLPNTDRLARRG